MAGDQCSDFGATFIADNKLCVINSEDLVMYSDGRVADIVSTDGENTVFATQDGKGTVSVPNASFNYNKTKDFHDTEGGNGGLLHGTVMYLPLRYKNAAITWSTDDLRDIRRVLGVVKGQTGNAFFCTDRAHRPQDLEKGGLQIAINKDQDLKVALANLEAAHDDKTLKMDEVHYEALKASLKNAAGIQEKTLFEEITSVAMPIFGAVMGVAMLLAFGTHGYKQWRDLFRKDPPDGPGGTTTSSKPNDYAKAPEVLPEVPNLEVPPKVAPKFSSNLKALARANGGQPIPASTVSDATKVSGPTTTRGTTTVPGGTMVPSQIGTPSLAPAPVLAH